jgi:hypothetical protein
MCLRFGVAAAWSGHARAGRRRAGCSFRSMPGGAGKVFVPRGRVRSDLDWLEHCKGEQCVESSAGHVMEVSASA